jgi:hypothetical protein
LASRLVANLKLVSKAKRASTAIEVGDTVEVSLAAGTSAGRQGIVLQMGIGGYVKIKYNDGPIVSDLWLPAHLKLVRKAGVKERTASTEIEVGDLVEVAYGHRDFDGRQGHVECLGGDVARIKYTNCEPLISGSWHVSRLKLVRKASKPQPGKTWHKGPPPHVGVWPASGSERHDSLRYWNGTHWSCGWMKGARADKIEDCKRTVLLAPQLCWYGYQPDEDGFIKWDGGDCPVEPGTHIRFKMRSYDGDHHRNGRPCSEPETLWPGWAHRQQPNDIVAYKVVQ